MLTLVVARYNEDVSWVNLIPGANVVIVNKSAIGNTGREASSYLWFIAKHYAVLEGEYLFCQGDPFPHCPDFVGRVNGWMGRAGSPEPAVGAHGVTRPTFGPRLRCDWEGNPHHPGLPLAAAAQRLRLFDVVVKRPIEFTAGAQFLRTAEEIQKDRCAAYYSDIKRYYADEEPQAPWVLERLWDYLIPSGEATAGQCA